MDPKTSSQILLVLSLVYGVTIGLLGAFGSGATTTVAIIGAPVLGLLWVLRGMAIRN